MAASPTRLPWVHVPESRTILSTHTSHMGLQERDEAACYLAGLVLSPGLGGHSRHPTRSAWCLRKASVGFSGGCCCCPQDMASTVLCLG